MPLLRYPFFEVMRLLRLARIAKLKFGAQPSKETSFSTGNGEVFPYCIKLIYNSNSNDCCEKK